MALLVDMSVEIGLVPDIKYIFVGERLSLR